MENVRLAFLESNTLAPSRFGSGSSRRNQDREHWLADVLASLDDGLIATDREGRVAFMNPAAEALTGWSAQDACGRPIDEVLGAAHSAFSDDWEALIEGPTTPSAEPEAPSEGILFTKQGQPLVVTSRITPVRGKAGGASGILLRLRPTNGHGEETIASSPYLAQRLAYLEDTLRSIGDALIMTDPEGRIVYLNPAAESLTGWSNKEARGQSVERVFQIVHDDSHEAAHNPVMRCLREGQVVLLEEGRALVRGDGQEMVVQDSAAPIVGRDGRIKGAVLICTDVTKLHRLARQMAYLASHDSLTGLLNRLEFESHLRQMLQETQEKGAYVGAICYLDLDHFKVINDTCGHLVGDGLLKRVASILQSHLGAGAILARLGGDEFGILFTCEMDAAYAKSEELCRAIRELHFVWEGQYFAVSASIGLVPIDAEESDLGQIMRRVDAACYVAKEQGRNRVHRYQHNDSAIAAHHWQMHWLQEIQQALCEERFVLYSQTALPLTEQGGHTRYREMLLRMLDQDGQIVPAATFVPIAERYHLMPALDRWVLRAALAEMQRAPDEDVIYGINLSGQSLGDPSFADFCLAEIARQGISPKRICFEIAESVAVVNYANMTAFMAKLRPLGCRFALDDFGSGLGSFGYLKSMRVDYLKIDGAFVRGMAQDSFDYSLVQAINQIGHTLGLETIAEYVENDHTTALLGEIGVDYAQGYGIERPGCS